MLKYTLAFCTELKNDIEKTIKVMGLTIQVIYILYLVYAMILSHSWTFWVNLAIFVISMAYFAFSIAIELKEKRKSNANVKRKVKKIYDATKKIIFLPTVIASIITMANLQNDNITISLLATVFVILSYVVYLLGIVLEKVFNTRVNRFLVALEADIDSVLPLINKFKRTLGDEAISVGGVDEDGSIKASLESIISQKAETKEAKKLQRAKTRAANKLRFKKEDGDRLKENVKSVIGKAKSKLESLVAKNPESLSAPTEAENKEPANK